MTGQSVLFEETEEFSFEVLKSWSSFNNHFEDASRLWCVTYCDSPDLLLEFFEEYDLNFLEVVVGDVDDYRERLRDEDVETVDRLERLKESGDLVIYVCPSKRVHSKMYVIEKTDGSVELITGSANLTRSGWGRQTNHVAVFETTPDSDLHDQFLRDYELHRDEYGERFLDDLTEQIESSDRPREEVINFWVEGKSSTKDELHEINEKAFEQIQDSGDGNVEQDIVLSLRGYDESVQETVRENFDLLGGNVDRNQASISHAGYSQFLENTFGLPVMSIDDRGVNFVPPGEPLRVLTDEPDAPVAVDQDLQNLEKYLNTVDDFGETNRPQAVKSHFFEALLYFLWAPFVNEHAQFFLEHDIDQLEKNLPYLYLYGESNSGKGTFCRYALSLISDNRVREPLDADELNRRTVRNVRRAHSCFPLVVDDIDKGKINSLEPLKNFWSGWDPTCSYPAMVFVSNDRKPDEWFRNRAKILHFDVMFRSSKKGEAEVNRLIKEENQLFRWFSYFMKERFDAGDVELTEDVLEPARSVLRELYDFADRPIPNYFPASPAENQFDIGRKRWHSLRENRIYEVDWDEDNLRLKFSDRVEHWEVQEYQRHLPSSVRGEQQGKDIVIKNPDVFREWLDAENDSPDGFLESVKQFFRVN